MEKEQLDQLKAKYPGGLYEGSISFYDENEAAHTVEFIYRKPTTADIEAHTKVLQRNPLVANINLIQSLIVHPESAAIITQIREYPAAVGHFVDEGVFPFFGGNVTIKRRKI
jgi:hypothetical protein